MVQSTMKRPARTSLISASVNRDIGYDERGRRLRQGVGTGSNGPRLSCRRPSCGRKAGWRVGRRPQSHHRALASFAYRFMSVEVGREMGLLEGWGLDGDAAGGHLPGWFATA